MTTPSQGEEPSPHSRQSPGPVTLLLCALIFLCAGFALSHFARRSNPAPQSAASHNPSEQTGILREILSTGTFEIFYAHPFASPTALEIKDDHEKDGWSFRITEQRADGFKLDINAGGGSLNDKPLRYVARGTPFDGTLIVQEGEALVPTASRGKPSELDVFYRTPFPSPPHLVFPKGLEWCTVTDQKATGFKLLREETSGIPYIPIRWRAEQAIRK